MTEEPEVSQSDGHPFGHPPAGAGAEGVGDGAAAGAVGVGTGGLSQRQSVPAGFTVRTGRACRGPGWVGAGRTGAACAGAGRTGVGGPGVGVSPAAGNRAAPRPTGLGDVFRGRGNVLAGPIPDSAPTAGGCGGNAAAAAGASLRSGTSPFTTTRYAPAAPSTVNSPNADTRAAGRGAWRGAAGGAAAGSAAGVSIGSESTPHAWPNVFIPVEVTSGPSAEGSAGRRPIS